MISAGDDEVSNVPPEVVRRIEDMLPSQIKTLPESERQRFAMQSAEIIFQAVSYSGVIPPPELIKAWEKVQPGAADRILALTEKQSDAAIERDIDIRRRDDRFRMLGLGGGFAIILAMLGCAIGSLMLGYPWVAAVFLSGGMLGMVAAFMKAASNMAQSDTKPAAEMPGSKSQPKIAASRRPKAP